MDASNAVIAAEIPSDHPTLKGHFPDYPVVPGAVVLSLVEEALSRWLEQPVFICSAPAIKFIRVVLPGRSLEIAFKSIAEKGADFSVMDAGEIAAQGRVYFDWIAT